MNALVTKRFQKLIEVNQPIIYIEDFDFVRVDEIIASAVNSNAVTIHEWNPATGNTDFRFKRPLANANETLYEFLMNVYAPTTKIERLPENPAIYVLREINEELDKPEIKTLLALISQRHLYEEGYDRTIVISSSVKKVPSEIERYVAYIDAWPMPSIGITGREEYEKQIERIIDEHGEINNYKVNENDRKELRQLLTGMSPFDIDRMIDMAMSNNGTLDLNDKEMLQEQKKTMVKQSGVLELIDKPASKEDIGGLDALKNYLETKASIYKDIVKATEDYGVSIPKGVFIVGMPGCGKSLCAKVSAALFDVPLLKLDMGSLMGKYQGESEANLRKAIRMAEAVAPSVLWIDEIEKAFSGVGSDDNAVLRRMFGYFLSWMQDKDSTVYVIATANNADNLPPELKRKGRFDEIFCVNLPSVEECKAIFKVHLNKKKKNREAWKNINVDNLAESLAQEANKKGCNGADIEAIINESVEEWFLKQAKETTSSNQFESILRKRVRTAITIKMSCKAQIEKMAKAFKENCFKDATTGKETNF